MERHNRINGSTRFALSLLLVLCCGSALSAQGIEPTSAQPAEAEAPEEQEEGAPRFEAEFVGSTIFQGATLAVGLSSPLTFESHFFGVEDNEIGMVGLAWTLSRGSFRVAPGFGWSFGSENRPAPVITVRWTYEHARWLTQGLWVQSLRANLPPAVEEEGSEGDEDVRHASILDGIHASAIVGRWEIGPLVENVRYREEREWKAGARVAWRAGEEWKLVGQVVGPGAEVRGGLTWERQ